MPRWALICLALAFVPVQAASKDGLGDMIQDKTVESMKKAGLGAVIFPHTRHEELLKCEACHPSLFKEKRGANYMTMQDIMDGKSCGTAKCHNSPDVFPLYLCAKCHTKIRTAK